MTKGGALVRFHDWRTARDHKAATRHFLAPGEGPFEEFGCLASRSHITVISGAQNRQARRPKNAAVFLVFGAGSLFRLTKSTRTPLENRWLFDGALYKKIKRLLHHNKLVIKPQ